MKNVPAIVTPFGGCVSKGFQILVRRETVIAPMECDHGIVGIVLIGSLAHGTANDAPILALSIMLLSNRPRNI
jgi:hypothetical protein